MEKIIPKTKRKINEIIVHCSATHPYQNVTVDDIRHWHKQRGFSDIGYHYVIYRNGFVAPGRCLRLSGAHCCGHNAHSIGICYVGGVDLDGYPEDNRSTFQKESLLQLIQDLCVTYPITKISGHNEYARKSCPCFDAKQEYSHFIQKLL